MCVVVSASGTVVAVDFVSLVVDVLDADVDFYSILNFDAGLSRFVVENVKVLRFCKGFVRVSGSRVWVGIS